MARAQLAFCGSSPIYRTVPVCDILDGRLSPTACRVALRSLALVFLTSCGSRGGVKLTLCKIHGKRLVVLLRFFFKSSSFFFFFYCLLRTSWPCLVASLDQVALVAPLASAGILHPRAGSVARPRCTHLKSPPVPSIFPGRVGSSSDSSSGGAELPSSGDCTHGSLKVTLLATDAPPNFSLYAAASNDLFPQISSCISLPRVARPDLGSLRQKSHSAYSRYIFSDHVDQLHRLSVA